MKVTKINLFATILMLAIRLPAMAELNECDKVLTFFGEPLTNRFQIDSALSAKVDELNAFAMSDTPAPALTSQLQESVERFQKYDSSLRRGAIEVDYLIDGGLLSLLGQGHLLIVGSGGNGKSMLAQKMLSHIVFPQAFTGLNGGGKVPLILKPSRQGKMISLFKKQMTNSTTFSDVFGAVNSQRLFNGDGMFERHLHQGILSRAFGFFDEFPDADARLLRALLNLLNERELSEAGDTFYAQTRSVFATSNYYPPEMLLAAARKGIKLEMLIDRFRYVGMVPKAFAQSGSLIGADAGQDNSYQKMFGVVLDGDGAEVSDLPIEDLLRLEALAKTVKVPELVRDIWERVAKRTDYELKLIEQSALEEYSRAKLNGEEPPPPYRMTKPMTKRTMGAGAAELRNIVVLDWIRREGKRPLSANVSDILNLQHFSGLVGPKNADLDTLIAASGHDKDELAALNTVKLERDTFVKVWSDVVDEILTEISRTQ